MDRALVKTASPVAKVLHLHPALHLAASAPRDTHQIQWGLDDSRSETSGQSNLEHFLNSERSPVVVKEPFGLK
jgi:hypothetical protein